MATAFRHLFLLLLLSFSVSSFAETSPYSDLSSVPPASEEAAANATQTPGAQTAATPASETAFAPVTEPSAQAWPKAQSVSQPVTQTGAQTTTATQTQAQTTTGAGAKGDMMISVSNVKTGADYANVLDYFAGLSVTSAVSVVEIKGTDLTLQLRLKSGGGDFLQELNANGHFRLVDAADPTKPAQTALNLEYMP